MCHDEVSCKGDIFALISYQGPHFAWHFWVQ